MPALLSLKSTVVSHLTSHTKHKITHIFNKTKLVANTEVTQTGRCFASKDLWYEKGRKEGPYLVTFFQGGPSFWDTCNNTTKAQSYHSGFYYSPWWEGTSGHVWHNRSDRLSAATLLCEWGKKNTLSTLCIEVGTPLNTNPFYLKTRLWDV